MNTLRTTLFSATAAFAFVGCIPVGGFDGEIDGASMPAQLTGLYGSAKSDDDVSFTQVVGLSFSVPCDRYGQWVKDRTDIFNDFAKSDHEDDDVDDAVADLEKVDTELGVPEEWWSVTVSIFDDADLDDSDYDAFGDDDAFLSVSIAHQTERPDYEKLLKKGEDPNVDAFAAIDGKIALEDVVDETSLRVTSDDLDLADAEDVATDGDDADSVGSGVLTLSAGHCEDLSDIIQDQLDDLDVTVDPPAEGEGEGEGEGDVCSISSDCPNIACICDDGSTLGVPVNTTQCTNQVCESPAQACPSSCEGFGFPWTGSIVDTTEPPDEPPTGPGETGTCTGHLGSGDGCDCGCGSFDGDCASSANDICEFNNCVSGAPELNDNASCG